MSLNTMQHRLAEIVALTEEKQRVDARLAVLRADLLAMCRERELRGVVGPTHEFRVSRRTALIIPNSGDPRRTKLERELKSLGYWLQVSQLSRAALQQLWKFELPPSDRGVIGRYVSREMAYQAILSRREKGSAARSEATRVDGG